MSTTRDMEKHKVSQAYKRIAHAILPRMSAKYPANLVAIMLEEGKQELAGLIPDIPYIGKNHVWQFNLETA